MKIETSKKIAKPGSRSKLHNLARLIRYYILVSTTEAGSGHPTSSLSATDLMIMLLYGGFFKFNLEHPEYPNNDRLIFSKGHASPLFYAMWIPAIQDSTSPPAPPLARGGGKERRVVDGEELVRTLRKFGSPFEGHPTPAFKFTEAATGSLGQGLSVGVGMALNAKYLDKLPYKTYVLLGDSEMAEGSVWEAIEIAAHYKLENLIGILDVNRLGQRGPTMYEHNLAAYEKRIKAFGWETMIIDGHDLGEIQKAFEWATSPAPSGHPPLARGGGKPRMIIAKTLKGKGVSFIEDKDGWHGKALPAEDLKKALAELGEVDKNIRGEIAKPTPTSSPPISRSETGGEREGVQTPNPNYEIGKSVATRKAYGNALARIGEAYPDLVVLDGEVSNSTFAEIFKAKFPERFFEMYIAEQNMVGVALGLSRRGKIPFVSSFAAFLTRAFDQIRMSQYSDANIKFCGSHAGVSIGEDGASQMGLEDLAMFRTLQNSVVLYPSDAISTEKLVELVAAHKGNVYIRTTRKDTPIIYSPSPSPSPQGRGKEKNDSSPLRGEVKEGVVHEFKIGGSCVLRSSEKDVATIVAAGITLHEALAAYEELKKEGINIRVIDLYSIKPLDVETLKKAAAETKAIITVEDHFPEGGIGEAVASALFGNNSSQPPLTLRGGASPLKVRGDRGELLFVPLAVRKMPRSGKPDELLAYEEIDKNAIIKIVKKVVSSKL